MKLSDLKLDIKRGSLNKLLSLPEGCVKAYLVYQAGAIMAKDIAGCLGVSEEEADTLLTELIQTGLIQRKPRDERAEAMYASKNDVEFMKLLGLAQSGHKRTLSPSQIMQLYDIYTMGIDADVIRFATSQLLSIRKYSEGYLKAVAETLLDKDIRSMEDIKRERAALSANNTAVKAESKDRQQRTEKSSAARRGIQRNEDLDSIVRQTIIERYSD